MKLRCICGHIIVDASDNLPYKGYMLPDSHLESVATTLTDIIDTLVSAIKSDKRLDWINRNFQSPPYPTDLTDSSMIHDLLLSKLLEIKQTVLECENCGRIAIQVTQKNEFKFFAPETDDTRGILKGTK